MAKLRQIKNKRFTRVTASLYRGQVYRLVQDFLGYQDPGEAPDREALVQAWQELDSDEREGDLETFIDAAIEQWERDSAQPEAILSEPYLAVASYAELRRAEVPPAGETRAVLRKQIAQQRKLRRLRGQYPALKLRQHEGKTLAMLDWLHPDILDLHVSDPQASMLVQSPHAFLREADQWLHAALPGEGKWHLRMGGSAKFFHPAGEGQKLVDQELHRDDRPEWLRRLQEKAIQEVE